MDILDISDPIPTAYTPDQFFQIFDRVLEVEVTSPKSTNAQFFSYIAWMQGSEEQVTGPGDYLGTRVLRQFIATAILVYNDQFMRTYHPIGNVNCSAGLALTGNQVILDISQANL